jgi:hypothetical protein
MTRRILFATAVLCAVFCGAALAADISGNWSGTIHAGDEPVPLTFAFKQDGEKLTGTVTHPQGPPLTLSDGKVQGEKVTFSVQAEMNGSLTKFVGEGVVKGEEITLNLKAEGGPDFGSTLLKRVK